ncbi:hypothetical protein GCM10010911_30630 [Paenibacillus nasutitermitis]|uniref:Recombinase zinc beta ribbon domain-containing protein n=2 Tax=Paenibacillus nasutitermitis TaxID=1652958 RepID=A0A916Z0N2_9BACL|nr:hypothetical protein GCM10010911_30630 [Paenibacillus nasutitermitis]
MDFTVFNIKFNVSTSFVNKIKKYGSSPSYRCSNKWQGKSDCVGQGTFAAPRIESIVLKRLDAYLDDLEQRDFTVQIEDFKEKNIRADEKILKTLQNKIEEFYSELSTLSAEVPKSIWERVRFLPNI